MSALWCSQCNEIFDEGVGECPFCGGALEAAPEAVWSFAGGADKALAAWPMGEDGAPVAKAYLKTVSTAAFEDETLCSMLAAYDIPTTRQYTNNGEFGKIILGTGAGIVDIFVPQTMLEDAHKLIDSPEALENEL